MHTSNQTKLKCFFKKAFSYIVYFLTALASCFLALAIVLNFLSPAISEERNGPSHQREKLTLKRVFGDIFKNLKTIAKDGFSEEPKSSPHKTETPSSSESSKPVEIPKEDLNRPEDLKAGSETLPKAPENFEGEAYGDLVRPSSDEASPPSEGESLPPKAGGDEPPLDSHSASSPSSPEREPPAESVPQQPMVQQPEVSPGQEAPSNSAETDNTDFNSSEVSLEIQSYMAPFIYESIQQRDPFEDPTVKKEEEGQGVIIIPKTPPEEYALKTIQLKGIIWDTKNPKALFKLPDNAGYYTLIKGDKIGKKGVIFDIRESDRGSEVVIVETNFIGSNERKKEERTIKIKKIDRIGVMKE